MLIVGGLAQREQVAGHDAAARHVHGRARRAVQPERHGQRLVFAREIRRCLALLVWGFREVDIDA